MSWSTVLVDAPSKIGRSFSLATFIPVAFLVVWLTSVAVVAAPFECPPGPSIAHLVPFWSSWSAEKVAVLTGVTLSVALLLHPLLFATTQLLEGYWGAGRASTMLAVLRANKYRRKVHELDDAIEASNDRISERVAEAYAARFPRSIGNAPSVDDFRSGWLGSAEGKVVFFDEIDLEACRKARSAFPLEADRTMPTRLGNALRRDEDRIGRQYGLDVLKISGHLAWVAPAPHQRRVDDSRHQFDAAVRHTSVGLIGFVFTAAILVASGWYLLLALIPYFYAYVSYRGAIASANEYTFQMSILVDLDRFALYEALRLPVSDTTDDERDANRILMELLSGQQASLALAPADAARCPPQPRRRARLHG